MFRNEIAPELVAVSVRQVVLHALDLLQHLLDGLGSRLAV